MRNSMRNRSVWLQTDEGREHMVCTLSTHISFKSAWAQLSGDVSCVYSGRHTLDRRLWEVQHTSSKFCLGAPLVNSIFLHCLKLTRWIESFLVILGAAYISKTMTDEFCIYSTVDLTEFARTAVKDWRAAGFLMRTALQCRFNALLRSSVWIEWIK